MIRRFFKRLRCVLTGHRWDFFDEDRTGMTCQCARCDVLRRFSTKPNNQSVGPKASRSDVGGSHD